MAIIGKLSEWSKEPHSKCGVHLKCTEGSNPPLSAKKRTICLSEFTQASKSLFFLWTRCQRQLVGFSRWHCLCNAGVLESLSYQNLSVQVYLSKQISLLCCKDAVGRLWGLRSNPSLSRMPAADFGDYAAIPHFPGCRRQTLGITQQSLTFQDAVGRLLGLRSNPSLSRMPAAACWDYAAIPHLQGCRRQTFGIT